MRRCFAEPWILDGLAEPGDMATIRQPLDFYGVNYYYPLKVAAAPEDASTPFELTGPAAGHGSPWAATT